MRHAVDWHGHRGALRLRPGSEWLSPRLQRLTFLALVGLAVLLIGVVLGGGGQGATYQVNVRSGAALPLGNGDALVALPGSLVENLVRDNLAHSDLPVSGLAVHYGGDGISIAGKADVDLTFAAIGVPFSTRAIPVYDSQNGLSVHLSDTRAVGGRLPNLVQDLIEAVVNRSIRDSIRLQGYAVDQVELSADSLLVYVKYQQPSSP